MITFPVKIISSMPKIPDNVQIGDFIVARYRSSRWAKLLPWEDWHHAALVSQTNPLTLIEAIGPNSKGQSSGPAEVLFKESAGWSKNKDLVKIKWLRPKFPNPIRETGKADTPRQKRKIITEKEARSRAVAYAKKQIGEDYSISASKWDEDQWYCSLLIYKSYSRTVSDMYLEDYNDPDDWRAGPKVTPEDLVDSPGSEAYFTWTHKDPIKA